MSRASTTSDKHAPTFEILLDGESIGRELAVKVAGIKIEQSIGLPDFCVFKVGFEVPEPGKAPPIDSSPFLLGKDLQVKLGEIEARRPTTTLFKGEIVSLTPHFGAGGVELTVKAFDRTHRLTRRRRSAAYLKMTDTEIVEKIVKDHQLTWEGDATTVRHDHVYQYNQTDMEFIASRAERIGFEVVADGGKVIFRRRGAGDEVELGWPDEVFEFVPHVTSTQQVKEVTVAAFDPKTKEQILSTSKPPRNATSIGLTRESAVNSVPNHPLHVASAPVATSGEAGALADSLLAQIAESYASAEGSCQGNPRIRAGAILKITGVGRQFGGRYRITTAVHELRSGGAFSTRFSSFPVQTVHGGGAGSSGASPDFAGNVALALVTNNNDPAKLGRVKVKFPALNDNQETDWIRVVTPSSGKERGLMMLPVPDEEVLVAFEHGTRPYVIGSLFNGKDTPGTELADTKGSLGLLSDERIVQRSKKDTVVSSDGKLEIKVKQDESREIGGSRQVKIQSNDQLEITGNLTAKAMQISIKGSGPVTIESSAPVTVKSTAMTSIQGGTVEVKATGPLIMKGNPIMLN